ncbi:MAG: MFS transporter [Chloroflexi bacterium]|nr:MFS transporter [Chloroflexota bacterium]
MKTTKDSSSRVSILVWITVCGFLTAFSYSSYSLFLPAFLREFNWTRGDVAIPFSLAMVAWGVMQPLAGSLADGRGTRPIILVGILLSAAGFLVMGFSHALWQIAIGFGVLIGTANSACGSMMFSILVSKWFTGPRRGSAVGVLQAATPASPIVMAPIVFYIITTFGWRYAALFLALLLLIVAFPLAYFVVRDPQADPGAAASHHATGQRGKRQDVLSQMRRPVLRNLFISRFACGLSFFIIPHLAAAATAAGLSATEGALAVSLYGFTSAAGSLAGGFAADRWGRTNTLMATYFIRGVGALALALPAMNPSWFYVGLALAAGPVFATVTINNVQIFEVVGPRRAGVIMGVSFVLHQVASALSPYAAGLVFDATGGYQISFLVLGVVMLLAVIPASKTKPEPLIVQAGVPQPSPSPQ